MSNDRQNSAGKQHESSMQLVNVNFEKVRFDLVLGHFSEAYVGEKSIFAPSAQGGVCMNACQVLPRPTFFRTTHATCQNCCFDVRNGLRRSRPLFRGVTLACLGELFTTQRPLVAGGSLWSFANIRLNVQSCCANMQRNRRRRER